MGQLTTALTATTMMAISNPDTLAALYINTTKTLTQINQHTYTTHTPSAVTVRGTHKRTVPSHHLLRLFTRNKGNTIILKGIF